jgi:FKBP-type peptidyl-prolyl cis-trans isomerase
MQYIPKKPLTWIILAIVVYAYIDHNRASPTASDKKTPDSPDVFIEPANKELGVMSKPINFLLKEFSKTETGQTVLSALLTKSLKNNPVSEGASSNNAYSEAIINKKNIIRLDQKIGTGEISVCGSEIQIHYQLFIENSTNIDSTKTSNQPAILTIGDNKYIKGLENGIIGMSEGGKRKIAIPSHLAYDDTKFSSGIVEKNTPIIAEVELISVRNGISTSPITDSETLVKGKTGRFALCGDTVEIGINNLKGKSEKFSFRLGDKNIPLGFNEAIIGMNITQKNKVTIRKDLLTPTEDNKLNRIINGDVNNITLEIELLSIK